MSAILTTRCHRLAESLGELKIKVRAALATELAQAVGTAVRDVLVVALIDRIIAAPTRSSYPSARAGGWRDGYDRERDHWDESTDPWADPDDSGIRDRPTDRYPHDDREEVEPTRAVPTAAAVVIGVNAGRWWLARHGSVAAAIGIGVATTVLGLAGGPLARAALAVLAAATDVLTAESALARVDHS